VELEVGLCGADQFGTCFVPVFQHRPEVAELYLADVVPERLTREAARFGVTKTFDSLEALGQSDCDCVALFTQRWLHAPGPDCSPHAAGARGAAVARPR